MKRIYLDHAAATPVDLVVLSAMQPFFGLQFANPSGIHKEGVAARSAVEDARKRIATLLCVQPDELVFTASATESANLALRGAVEAWKATHPERAPHIIISAIEHEAVFAVARVLENEGTRVSILPVGTDGAARVDELAELITVETVLVALMYANNEIGTIEPVSLVAKAIRKWKKEVRGVVRSERIRGDDRYPLLYSDASQAPNYLDCAVPALGVDMLTISAAKIYGPKGAGLLFVSRGTQVEPLVQGGGQERGLRAGTENVPAIVGFASAFEIAARVRETESARLRDMQTRTVTLLQETFPDIIVNGSLTERLPNNISFSFPNVDHEYLAITLDARGFAVATKSACSESEAETSHVLLALAHSDQGRPVSGIRVSMGRGTTMEDMSEFVATLSVIRSTMLGAV